MQKSFFSHLFLIVLLNLLVKPFFLFGIDAQVQNQVGTEDYGLYFSLLNFSFLFSILLDVGITNYNAKNIAESPLLVHRYFGSMIGVRILLGLIYAAITVGAGLLLDYDNKQMQILSFLTLNQFLASMVLYLRSNFAGLHLFRVDAFLSVLDRFLLIVICSVLLYSSAFESADFQIEWFVLAQTFSYGMAVAIGLLISMRKISTPRIRLKKSFSIVMIRKTMPYALLTLLMMLYSRTDAVMIERLLEDGKYQAGIYAQGFRLLDAANIFALLVAGLLLPIFARKIKQKEEIQELLRSNALLLISVSVTIGVVASVYAKPILDWIYSYTSELSFAVFPWIILSFIPMCCTYVFGTLLTANGNMKQLNQMAFFSLFLNIVLNYIFILKWGAYGGAIATFITQCVAAIWQMLLAKKLFELQLKSRTLLQLLAFSSLVFSASLLLKDFFESIPLIAVLLSLMTSAILILIFRLVSFQEITSLIRRTD